MAILGYLLFFLGIFFGVTALIGAVINHTHLHKTVGTIARSHLMLQLIGFWSIALLASLCFVFSGSTAAASIAWIVFFLWLFTLIAGSMLLSKHREVPFLDH